MLERISNPRQLAAVCTAADVFFNPTQEDNCPTVNLEAMTCGSDVIYYDAGGCQQILHRRESTVVVNFSGAFDNNARKEAL